MVEDWVLQMARDGIHSYSAGRQDLDNFAPVLHLSTAALQHCSTAPALQHCTSLTIVIQSSASPSLRVGKYKVAFNVIM